MYLQCEHCTSFMDWVDLPDMVVPNTGNIKEAFASLESLIFFVSIKASLWQRGQLIIL